MKKNYIIIISLLLSTVGITQNKAIENFDKKVSFALWAINTQRTHVGLIDSLPKGLSVDSITGRGYYLKYMKKTAMTIHFDKDTVRIIAVSFDENKEAKEDIYNYVENDLKYKFTSSENACDYYSKGKNIMRFCPMGKKLSVYIEKSTYKVK